jgi:drug/metabolite transporter (DMT)-like permease
LRQRTKAELLLVITTFIWGSSFVIVKDALSDAGPFPFLAVRFALAALVMFGFMARGRLPRSAILPSVVLGVMLFIGYAFQTWGLTLTTPSKSGFITGFGVIMVPLFALFSGHPMRATNFVGAGLGFLGLYFLVMPFGMTAVNRGDVLTLLGATAFAIHIVLVGTYTRRHSFLHLAPGQIIVVALLAALAIPFSRSTTLHWTRELIFAIVVTALFATAFAFAAQVWAQQYTPPAHTALIFALEPVFAALTSRIVLHEHLGRKALWGAAFILAGMIISEMWGGTGPAPVEG